ncbi:MAG: sulfotransferase, partial [Bdellovibrionales bacterium]
MKKTMKQQCIITAIPRSGGSMLARLFDGHPVVASYPFHAKFGDTHAVEAYKATEIFPNTLNGTLKSVMEDHGRYKRFENFIYAKKDGMGEILEYDQTYFEKQVNQTIPQDCSPAHFRELFSHAFFDSHNFYKGRWANIQNIIWYNTHLSYNIGDLIERDNIKLIMLFRHPFDSLSSIVKKWGDTQDFNNHVYGWRDQYLAACYYRQKHPEMVKILRYEDLVQDPHAAMTDLAEFLNISFEDCLTKPSLYGNPWNAQSSFDNVKQAITTNAIGRFEGVLSQNQLNYISSKLGRYMES